MQAATTYSESTEHELYLIPGISDIGHANENHIQLNGPSLLAKIVTYFHESFIIDLNSTNGIYLNGKRIYKHSLKAGDRLQIGCHYLVVKPPARDSLMSKTVVTNMVNALARPKTS